MDDKTMEWIKELYQKNLELELKVKELEWKIEQLNDRPRPYDKGDIGISFGHSEPIFSGASQGSTGCSIRDSWSTSECSTGFSRSIGISRSEGVASDAKCSGIGRIVGIS